MNLIVLYINEMKEKPKEPTGVHSCFEYYNLH